MNAATILSALACGSGACSCAAAARRGSGLTHCLTHVDTTPSLNVSDRDGRTLVHCHGGCDQDTVLGALSERGLWNGAEPAASPTRVVARYSYTDEAGALLYELERLEPKRFRVRRPDGKGGWVYGLGDAPRVLYRLPELRYVAKAGWRVYVVEGEKDADALTALGLRATTAPFGAGKWRDEYADALTGAEVVAIADKDGPGRAHAHAAARSCSRTARSIRVLELPGDMVKDAADWISAGGTRSELEALADATAPWSAAPGEPSPAAIPDGARAVVASSVKRERVEYLDAERMIPLRASTVLAGPPGLGKSQWTAQLAARNPGVTLIATAEDSLAAVVRPRLEAAGADLERVHFVVMRRDGSDEGIDLPDDVAELDRLVQESGASLVVIDPLMAHLPETVNSWRDQSIRRALAPLHRLAERRGCAIVVVVHLNKREGDDPLQRVGGSIGITGAARSVLLLARDPEDPDGEVGQRRVLAHVKSNYGPERISRALRIEPFLIDPKGDHIETSRIVDEGESPHLGRDLLVAVDRDEGKRGEAVAFLFEELHGGPRPPLEVIESGKARGFSERTVKRAKKELGVRSERVGFGKDGEWHWTLPGTRTPAIEGHGPVSDLAPYEESRERRAVSHDPDPIEAHADTLAPYVGDDPMRRVALNVLGQPNGSVTSPERPDNVGENGWPTEVATWPEAHRRWLEQTVAYAVSVGMDHAEAERVALLDVRKQLEELGTSR